jgi:hypothetical protein
VSFRALQRCACGGTPGPAGECAECRARRLAHQSVQQTLQAPARPLDTATRGAFEREWGHDLSGVRIHADEDAARSAEAVGAEAYTVGRDVVFARGRYEPASESGRRLLAHELTHVRQQDATPPNGAVTLLRDAAAENEADRAPAAVARRVPPALQRQEDPFRLGQFRLRPMPPPMLIQPGSIRETFVLPALSEVELEPLHLPEPAPRFPRILTEQLRGPAPLTPVTVIPVSRCVPDRALTWADFQGTPPGGTFAAFTRMRTTSQDVQGNVMFRAVMDHGRSWVRPKYVSPGARATNGCGTLVGQCQHAFADPNTAWWEPPQDCPAALVPRQRVTSSADCEAVIGAGCDSSAPQESARLLRHEQGHYDIACNLVGRADDALAAGRPQATVSQWLSTNLQPQNDLYDKQAVHGCDAGQQSTWETAIAGGLQAVTGP